LADVRRQDVAVRAQGGEQRVGFGGDNDDLLRLVRQGARPAAVLRLVELTAQGGRALPTQVARQKRVGDKDGFVGRGGGFDLVAQQDKPMVLALKCRSAGKHHGAHERKRKQNVDNRTAEGIVLGVSQDCGSVLHEVSGLRKKTARTVF